MQTVDADTRYVVNPAYKFKDDFLNIIITNNNPGRYDAGLHRDDITIPFAWRTHPDLAYLFSYFDGSRTLAETAAHFAEEEGVDRDRFLASVSPCICNDEPILIPADERQWVSIPKNFLIPNATNIVRGDLLWAIDLPFIRKHFDLTEIRLRVPNSMTLMLNTSCVTDCVYCYADRPHIRRPIPFWRIRTLIREAYSLGMPDVDVDGGDFFLYEPWRELTEEMLKHDYIPTISTKCPLTKEIVDDLKSLGIKQIQLSIDSVDQSEARQMLHVGGDYTEKVLQGLRLLNDAGLKVIVKPVITRFNDSERSLDTTIDTLTAFGCVRRIDFTPASFSRFKPNTFFSSRAQLARLKVRAEERNRDCAAEISFSGFAMGQTAEERGRSFPHRAMCTGNVHGFFVLPDGKVTVCEQMYWHPFFILGDLNTQSIMEMWTSKNALSLWNFSREEVRDASPCKQCDDFDECRRGLGNCWRQAISAYGPENYDFPAPECPKAPPVEKDFYIP